MVAAACLIGDSAAFADALLFVFGGQYNSVEY